MRRTEGFVTRMPVLMLTALTMVAFAANSILNRVALAGDFIDAGTFGVIRLMAGAGILIVLVMRRDGRMRFGGPARMVGVISLLLYIFGFSAAYIVLDAGLGALILFGCVQLTMFAGGLLGGERPAIQRWVGAVIALAGLVWLLLPGEALQLSLPHAALMALAGMGWGIYSLAGRKAVDALRSTAANFALAVPVGLVVAALMPGTHHISVAGVTLAVVSGAITSGLGYALWYSVLPRLTPSGAAVAQLTVPVIAIAGGVLFLGEAFSWGVVLPSLVVLLGVGLSALPMRQRTMRSRGS